MKQHKKQVAAMTMAVAFAVSTIATASPGLVYAQETTEESPFTDGAQGSGAAGSSGGTENTENTGSTESNTGKIEQEAFSDGAADSVGSSFNMKPVGETKADGTSMLDTQTGG